MAVGVELLDSVVPPISDVNIPGLVDGDTPRHVELALCIAQRAPLGNVLTVCGQNLYPVVECIYHVEIATGSKGQPGWSVKLTRPAALFANSSGVISLCVKDADAVGVFVGNVDFACLVKGNVGNPNELAWFFTPSAELIQEITVSGTTRDADTFLLVGIGAAGHVQHTVWANSHRYRAAESWAGRRQQTNHAFVLVESVGGYWILCFCGHLFLWVVDYGNV